jgi:adenylate cyclase
MQANDEVSLTEGSPGGRRLVAVVYADMVGYSHLIGLDDSGTLERLRSLRRNLIDPAITEFGGRIFKTGGDSLLIAFDSIDGAVRCAVKVQQQVPAYDSDQPPDRAMRFRIGINIGDAIADGTDFYGDVVNVAARLQAECPPGDICVARSVRDHVHGRLDLVFEELGALRLKNIARPVEAFVARLGTNASLPPTAPQLPDDSSTGNLAAPRKPSIAVLAFSNMSGNPEQEYFSDGISDDIITELSRSRSLFVMARNSSFTYKGRPVDVKQVARELGVRYVVDGGVRRSGDRVRVTAQLVEAATGSQIWAERYDRDVQEIFALQDEITTAIVKAIIPVISDAELGRILRKPPGSLDAWEAYQRGLWHMEKHNAADHTRANELLSRAIALDAAFAAAYSTLAELIIREGVQFSTRPLHEAAQTASGLARKAVEINADDSEAWAMLAIAVFFTGDVRAALEHASTALVLNPNSAWANSAKGGILVDTGHPAEARDLLLAALRLSPRDFRNAAVLNHVARTYYYERDYERAAEAGIGTVARYPDHPTAYCWLAAAQGQLGRFREADDALQKARAIAPASLARLAKGGPPFFCPENHEHMLDGLRKAGWHE